MPERIKMICGDEYDGLTGARAYYHWRAGDRSAIKRRYNKRLRGKSKATTKKEYRDMWSHYLHPAELAACGVDYA